MHRDLEAFAAERLIHDGVVSVPVDNHGVSHSFSPFLLVLCGENVAHAAQVAFALFAYIADEDDVVLVFDVAIHQSRRNGEQRRDSTAVIRDTRPVQLAIFIFANVDGGAGRKYGIDVCSNGDDFLLVPAAMMRSKNAAQLVGMDVFQAKLAESL